MPNKKDVGIVIVNWRSGRVILECLKSIREAGYIESVVVVDNGSEDGSLSELRSTNNELRIIENEENLGFAEGNNKGIRYLLGTDSFTIGGVMASLRSACHPRGVLRQPDTIRGGKEIPKYIFVLNPDTEINKDTIPNLLTVMEEDRSVGISGPKILFPSPRRSHGFRRRSSLTPSEVSLPLIWSCGGVIDKKRFSAGLIGLGEVDRGQYDSTKTPSRSPFGHLEGAIPVDYIPGTAMMVKREVFEKCGLFNSDYFIYYEDVELNIKTQRAGFKTVIVPSAEILHKESSSMGKSSPAQEYYMARNHLLFVERNAPFSIKVRESIRLPKTIYQHLRKKEIWAIKGIEDYMSRKFGKSSYF